MSHPGEDEPSLPADLADLERRLTNRAPPEAPPNLRRRLQDAVARALNRQSLLASQRQRWGRYAVAAAALLVWLNFSASLVNNMAWRFRADAGGAAIADLARRVRELAPELTPQEAQRQALLLRAGTQVTPAPYARATLDRFLRQRRDDKSWATP